MNQNAHLKPIGATLSNYGYHFGICVPNKCSAQDLSKAVSILHFEDKLCYTKADVPKMTTGSIIALSIIGIILVIATLSTIFDIVTEYRGIEPKFEALVIFSLYTNGRKLLKSSKNPDQLLCINGLKALSMMWVVLGHTYANFGLSSATDNFIVINDWLDDTANMFLMSATLSVDTFFTIGGLLTVYTYMKSPKMELKQSFKAVPLIYIHRYLRLTPALAVIILVYATGLIRYIGDGPRWGSIENLAIGACETKWWSTLLYIQNYYDSTAGTCIDQSWYLSVDIQLFLLTPFILIPLRKWPKYTIPAMYILVAIGIIVPFYIGYSDKLSALVFGSMAPAFTTHYYFKTHARFGPYVIGMLTGYFIYKVKNDVKAPKWSQRLVLLLWTISLAGLIACIFDGYKLVKHTDNALADGFYLGFNRNAWSVAISILVVLCVTGNGGPINWMLSLPVFQFLSKLSYSIYLVHYGVITVVNLSSRETTHFSNFDAVFQFFAFFVLVTIVSVFFCLIFESPMVAIEKLIFPSPRSRIVKKGNNERV